jgi:two-component system, NarL family, response regulator LiaR
MTEEAKLAETIRILLVEDHLLTRIGLKTVVERQKDLSVVGEAENGEEAVTKAEELRPDIILMDVGMPLMDGIEAARRIKEKNIDTEIVMLTSHDNERDIFASLAAGAGGYCLKDVAPDRLYSAIRSVNAGDVWLDSTIASKVLKQYQQGGAQPSTAPSKAASPQQALPEPLSPRELEVLTLLVEGLSNQQIADRLIISLATAKTHVRNILNKLAVDDRTQAAVHAMRRGLV